MRAIPMGEELVAHLGAHPQGRDARGGASRFARKEGCLLDVSWKVRGPGPERRRKSVAPGHSLDRRGSIGRSRSTNITRTCAAVDHRSFRDQLLFSIGFAVTRSRDLLRRLLKEHAPDDARQILAERVMEHLERSGFEIDEAEQVMRKRPPTPGHG
jgi:hypothetical protein